LRKSATRLELRNHPLAGDGGSVQTGTPGTGGLTPLTPRLLHLLYIEHRMSLEQIARRSFGGDRE